MFVVALQEMSRPVVGSEFVESNRHMTYYADLRLQPGGQRVIFFARAHYTVVRTLSSWRFSSLYPGTAKLSFIALAIA